MKFFSYFLLLYSTSTFALESKDVDFFGYARAGVGTNTYGGDQECFYNQGSGGWGGIGRNEFRLANECTNYLELGLRFNHERSVNRNVFTQFRLANSHAGADATEGSTQSTNFVEAFAEIQGVENFPWNVWVGKKFYRDHDVYIDDYYYFGSMNGNGAGVGNIDILGAKLALAYLRRVTDTRTNLGLQGITIYDTRIKKITLHPSLEQNIWFAYGHAPESSNSTSGIKYQKSNGFVLGSLFNFTLTNGFNHFAIMYGSGLMNNFNLYGDSLVTAESQQDKQKRWRFVNHTTKDLNTKWSIHLSLNHERLTETSETTEHWTGLGIRPVYKVTNQFHMVSEIGSSIVQNNGARRLFRATLAPQLSINDNIWGRPVLRAFYTHSFWNNKNKIFIAQNAPTYSNKTAGGAFGFQMETFF